jgi:methyl-accepting chemotaxis protein
VSSHLSASRGLATRVLRAIVRPGARGAGPVDERGPAPGYCATVEASVRLDDEICRKLDDAVGKTEQSALAIMGQVRALCDRSASLVTRLGAATAEAGQFESEIQGNVDALEHMASFLAQLPERLHRDLDHIAGIAAEIKSLSDLAESVQVISMQSHMLSINAAIEASRAGPGGEAFKVVAQEVRELAANSHGAASSIGKSLATIRSILKDGLEDSAARSSNDLDQIHATAEAVTQLRASCSRIVGTYQAGFADMLEHGEMISYGTGEVLGQLQYQDIVRQCVERLQAAIGRRNAVLEKEFGGMAAPRPELVAALIGDVLEEYLAGEALHGGAAEEDGGGPAIELF